MMYIPKFNVNTLVSSFLQSEILAAKIALERFAKDHLGVVHILRNHFWGSRETPPPYVIL